MTWWPAGRRRRRERGSGTVLVLGVVGLLVGLVVGALSVVSAVVESHRAQSAADLSALAAAALLVRGDPPDAACAVAVRVAGRNGGSVAACRTGSDLSVEVVVEVPANLPKVGSATARSRAGPGPEPPG